MINNFNKCLEYKFKSCKDLNLSDCNCKGLRLRYSAKTSRKIYYFWYRNKLTKIQRNIKIGDSEYIDLSDARIKARQFQTLVEKGLDPYNIILNEKNKLLEEYRKEKNNKLILRDLLDNYIEIYAKHNKKLSTYKNNKRIASLYINQNLGHLPINEIKYREISNLFNTLSFKSKPLANQYIALLSHFLNWCEDMEYRDLNSNPCRLIKKHNIPSRDRVLSHEEYRIIFNTIEKAKKEYDNYGYGFDVIKFLIFTGCRLSEAKNLRWDEVDSDNCLLRLHDSKTGQKSVPLGYEALNILKELRQNRINDYVFPSNKKDNAPLYDIHGPWEYIKKNGGLNNIRIHDLRHSFATLASMTGANASVLASVLGHRSITTTQRYIHLNSRVGVDMVERVGKVIAGLIEK